MKIMTTTIHAPHFNFAKLDSYILSLTASNALSSSGQYVGNKELIILCNDTMNDDLLGRWLCFGNGNRWMKEKILNRLRILLWDTDLERRLKWCIDRGLLEGLIGWGNHDERLLEKEKRAERVGGYRRYEEEEEEEEEEDEEEEEKEVRAQEEEDQDEGMSVDEEDPIDQTTTHILSPPLSPRSLAEELTEAILRENGVRSASSLSSESPEFLDDIFTPEHVSAIPSPSSSSAGSREFLDDMFPPEEHSSAPCSRTSSSAGSREFLDDVFFAEEHPPAPGSPASSSSGSREFLDDMFPEEGHELAIRSPSSSSSGSREFLDDILCSDDDARSSSGSREFLDDKFPAEEHPPAIRILCSSSGSREFLDDLWSDDEECLPNLPISQPPVRESAQAPVTKFNRPQKISCLDSYIRSIAASFCLDDNGQFIGPKNILTRSVAFFPSSRGHRVFLADGRAYKKPEVIARLRHLLTSGGLAEELEVLASYDRKGLEAIISIPEHRENLKSEPRLGIANLPAPERAEREEQDKEEEFGISTADFPRESPQHPRKRRNREETTKDTFIKSLCASFCLDNSGNFVGRRKLLLLYSYVLPPMLYQRQAVGYGLAYPKPVIMRRMDNMLRSEGLENELKWHIKNGRLAELTPFLSHKERLKRTMERIYQLRLGEGAQVPEIKVTAPEVVEEKELVPLSESTDEDDKDETDSYFDADSEFDVASTAYTDDSDPSDCESDVNEESSDLYESNPGSVANSEDGESEYGESEEEESKEEESEDNESNHGIEFTNDWESSDSESIPDAESPDTSSSSSGLPAPSQPFLNFIQISLLHQLAPHFQSSLTPLHAAPAPSDRLPVLDSHLRSLAAAICLGPSGNYVGRNELLRLASKFSPDTSKVEEFTYSLAEVSARLISLLDDKKLGEALEWLVEQHRLEYFVSYEQHRDMLRDLKSRVVKDGKKSEDLISAPVQVQTNQVTENKPVSEEKVVPPPESDYTLDESYIPYDVQYQFILHLQSALELACFTWLRSNHPEFLEGNNWEVPEAANLEQYINIIHGPFLVAVPTSIKDSMLHIHKLAIHREPLNVKQIFQIIDSGASSCSFLANCGKFKGTVAPVDEKKVLPKKIIKLKEKLTTFMKQYNLNKERMKQWNETLAERLAQVEALKREILEGQKMEQEFNSWFKDTLSS
jgi:hypothetical protein